MKKYRCGKCGEIFVGRLEICPKCGVELHYLDQEVKKEKETSKKVTKFHFEDEDVIKTGINEQELTNNDKNKKKEDVVDKRPQLVLENESFYDGNTFIMFLLRLLGFILFFVTLTISYPWTMCMIYRYQTKHTVVNGYRLKFDGKGSQLLGRYLLWLLLTILTVGIFLIFLTNKIRIWKAKHTFISEPNKK
jgi:hypothetical protein